MNYSFGSDAGDAEANGQAWTAGSRRSEFRAFLDDLSALIERSTGRDLRREIEQRVDDARDRLSQAMGQAQEASSMAAERAREAMNRTLDASRDVVTERPVVAIAAAAGVGLLIGLLLRSRR